MTQSDPTSDQTSSNAGSSPAAAQGLTPPPAPTDRPVVRELWGETYVDRHAWLRDGEDPTVVVHLEAENAYSDAYLAPTEGLQEEIFQEIRSRIQETDLSVPVEKDGWSYYGRTEEGKQYGIHCRRWVGLDGTEDGPEQILLDENVEVAAGESEYFEMGVFEVSPDHALLLWGADRDGNEQFEVRVRNLDGDDQFDDVLQDLTYGSAWALDNRSFFYVRLDAAHRPHQVWHHVLGDDPAGDRLVYQDDDERFFVSVGRDKDDSYIYIASSSAITDEVSFIPADAPLTDPVVFAERETGVEYSIAHHIDRFVITTNLDATNFRIATCPETSTARDSWQPLVAERDDVMVTGLDVFTDRVIVFERAAGLTRISFGRWDEVGERGAEGLTVLDQPEPVYSVWPGANVTPDSDVLRYGYSSFVTPQSVMTYNFETGERILLKQQEVLGDFDADAYETRREWAVSHDGTRVPISLVGRKDRPAGGPAMLYAYGAYEMSLDPTFSTIRLSLLDRGFVFAVAHPRGGGELGRRWYEDGKYEKKINTFHDVVASARHLIDTGITVPDKLALRGGSAGGLMVGAVLNLAPELFGAAVAEVPFVDVISTMLDPTLPLTVTEWEEWGNPRDNEQIYRAMRTYAPLENVADRPYPAVMATAGLTDPRVGFWEPAKWVAALREHSTSGRPVILKTEMSAGHFGPSGRYAAWKDEAKVFAFIIDALGVAYTIRSEAEQAG